MEISGILSLAYVTLKNKLAVGIFKNLGVDFTYPCMVQAKITNKCNSRCNMCEVWREEADDLPASVWIDSFSQLRSTGRFFKICYTGGEVFLKQDAFEIFNYCNEAKIPFGITTNGYLLNRENTIRLMELNPLNINISLDSLSNETYKNIRGVYFVDTVKSNIDFLMRYINENSLKTKVFIKTVINSHNLHELHLLARYAKEKNIAGITFDPIKRKRKIFLEEKNKEFEKMIDIDMASLWEAKQKLIELKKQRYNILNSKKNIMNWFTAAHNGSEYFCDAPLLRINITSEGQVRLCDYFESHIGNIATDNVRLLLEDKNVREQKKRLTYCKEPCEYCIQRNISDYFRVFLSYIKS